MKVLLVNGSPHKTGCTYTALNEIAKVLEEEGIESEILWLGKEPVPDCIACLSCRRRGVCVYNDSVNDIGARIDEFDGFVFGSPVYYSGPTGAICSWMDRFFYTYSSKLARKPVASVVSARRSGTTATFERLNQYYLMCNMVVVGSQYWNNVHGSKPEDVEKDEEGLQTMRTLGRNLAYVIKCMGTAQEVTAPRVEEHLWTNFIR